ncbi:MAG: lycopene cyclase domain-containing protein [Candidatus Omnitrophica bacterium]|nr:lycopene cyclase domain-containing protein [Candidatus Omnitrophota bacterium]
MMYTYLTLNVLTLIGPLFLSFERRVFYFGKWKFLFQSILIVSVPFLLWDHYFTKQGYWGFNKEFLSGIFFFGLPIEEVFFFLVTPFSCLFIYEVLKYFFKKIEKNEAIRFFALILAVLTAFISLFNKSRPYTALAFSSCSILLFINLFFLKPKYLPYFFFMYFISFIPFLLINGVLTNGLKSIAQCPVVWYNPQAIMNIRIKGIPVEDFFYSLTLLLANVNIYEALKNRPKGSKPLSS